ncbi:MAG: hypothetical protein HY000_01105 [Planctomycetes bacterium]|nr:hypothetical protein [Planctomycetota bacterium]
MAVTQLPDARLSLISPLHPLRVEETLGTAVPHPGQDERWDRIIDELLRLRSFQDDWDGQGAAAPNPANVDSAIEWVQQMGRYPQAIPPTQVVPGVAGELLLVWQGTGQGQPFFLEAEICTPRQVEWMLAVSGQPSKQWVTERDSLYFVGATP